MMTKRIAKVSLRAVRKIFKTRKAGSLTAIDHITFDIPHGAFVSFLGPSGCGKSTLLRLIAGLESPTTGSVLIDGRRVVGPQKGVGMVFQSYSSFPWLTVRQNVGFGLTLNGTGASRVEQEKFIDEMLDLVGLKEFEHAYPATLSGGMKQRVALARTLALSPSLLLLDEPFGALDAQTKTVLQDQLIEIWKPLDTTICFVTHDIEEALLLSDVICVFSARPGKIKKVITNPFPRPRDRSIQAAKTFLQTKMEIFELIKEDVYTALRYQE